MAYLDRDDEIKKNVTYFDGDEEMRKWENDVFVASRCVCAFLLCSN